MFKIGDKVRIKQGITNHAWTDRAQQADKERLIGIVIDISIAARTVDIEFEKIANMGIQIHPFEYIEFVVPQKQHKSWILK